MLTAHDSLEAASDQIGLIAALAAYSKNETRLRFSTGFFDDRLTSQIAEIISAIPASIILLSLSDSNFDALSVTELIEIFSAIPMTIKSLVLSDNDFSNRSLVELGEIFSVIPTNIESLDIGDNHLTADKIIQILSVLPKTIKSINLNQSDLGEQTEADLQKILKALSQNIESLNLSSNRLNLKSPEQLTKIFSVLPINITAINLGGNFMYPYLSKYINPFAFLPTSITQLKLDNDHLIYDFDDNSQKIRDSEPFKKILDSIPSTVKKLYLSYSFVKEMDSINRQALQGRFPGVDQITLVDSYLNPINSTLNRHNAKLYKDLGFNLSVPSLFELTALFASRNKTKEELEGLPENILEFIYEQRDSYPLRPSCIP